MSRSISDDAKKAARKSVRGSRLAARATKEALTYLVERSIRPSRDAKVRAKQKLGRGVLASAGFEVTVHGELPDERDGYLLVANHRSAFDIAVLLGHVPDAVLLSRGDLADWPALGWLAKEGDTLFVDRADRANGAKAIRAMRRALTDGRHLCVFPEGTTHDEETVRPFQAGAFAAARGLRSHVVPVGIAYAHGLEWIQKSMGEHIGEVLGRERLAIDVEIGAPLVTEGLRSDAAAELARDAVQALFARATARVRR